MAGNWRGRSSLRWSARTGPDGRFAGADLPAEPVTFTVDARGWMSKQATLTPSSSNDATAEQIIELVPPLRVAGSITDADTGAPLDRALVASGFNLGDGSGTRWDMGRRSAATNGKYRETMQGTMAGLQLRFEAEGYVSEQSRTFKPDEGRVTHDVKLRRRQGPAVVVVDPDGKPAEGVEVVALVPGQNDVIVQDGHVQTMYEAQVPSRSHADGRVDLELPPGDYVLLAVGEQGFVSVPSTQVAAQGATRLTLKRWSHVTGQALRGGKAATGQPVMVSSVRRLKSGAHTVTASVIANAISDEQGRFELNRCVPGPGTVGRTVTSTERATMVQEMLATIDVKPAPAATSVTIGGEGRTVRAKVVPPDDFAGADWTATPQTMAFLQGNPPPLPLPNAWLRMTGAEREKWTADFKQTDAGREWARQSQNAMMFRILVMGRNGSVKAEDVTPGRYVLTVQTSEPRWARGAHEFTVPEPAAGKPEGPLDLGNLELLPRFWPKAAAKPAAGQ
jgi:hypothetical protein